MATARRVNPRRPQQPDDALTVSKRLAAPSTPRPASGAEFLQKHDDITKEADVTHPPRRRSRSAARTVTPESAKLIGGLRRVACWAAEPRARGAPLPSGHVDRWAVAGGSRIWGAERFPRMATMAWRSAFRPPSR